MTSEPMPGFDNYKPKRMIRVSALNTFIRCPRLYFYQYGCNLQTIGDHRLALDFGEAIHAALGWLMEFPGDLEGALKAFDLVWVPELEALNDTKMGKSRNRTVAIKMLLHWMQTHRKGFCIWEAVEPPNFKSGIVPTEKQSRYEVPFAIDVGFPDIVLVGRIDGLARHRDTGELWLVEFKTGSEFSWNLLPNAFGNNTQALSYNLGIRTLGLKPRGTMIDLLLASYRRADCMTVPFEVSDYKIEAHAKLVRWKIAELLAFERAMDFPQNFGMCNTYSCFGSPGFTCDYSRLCEYHDWTKLKDTFKVREDQVFKIPDSLSLPVVENA